MNTFRCGLTSLGECAAASLLALAAVLARPGTAVSDPLPVPYSVAAIVSATLTAIPPYTPPGANEWSCIPHDPHPRPIVLVHGLFGNAANSWPMFAPLLANEGYCVFTLTYGVYPGDTGKLAGVGGRAPIDRSIDELREFIENVRQTTGSVSVDILSWSEGTVVTAGYIQFRGGADAVHRVVAMAPLWNGTAVADPLRAQLTAMGALGATYQVLDPACAACTELLSGSEFVRQLRDSGVYTPNVGYTNIVTTTDMQVQPYTSGIRGAPNATNIVLQDICPVDLSGHLSLGVDPTVAGLALSALDPVGHYRIPCTPALAPPGI
ncbi:esterase/lipase family protein [Nocardia arthritidis]|uniref:Lipase n=1 Tax=Nocardia arthritidis TaxID=228602 RepID=A0A6G9YLY0_9NOCA|nr:alpha/beta fold hydrolase [Nocardia arthritidis]QIS14202.1 lipase [Nocardia arthritidis]